MNVDELSCVYIDNSYSNTETQEMETVYSDSLQWMDGPGMKIPDLMRGHLGRNREQSWMKQSGEDMQSEQQNEQVRVVKNDVVSQERT